MFVPNQREMTAPWGILAQLFMIAIAYGAAVIAAGVFATFAVMNVGPAEVANEWDKLAKTTVFATTTTIAIALKAFWPTVVAAAVAEGLKVRGIVAYLVAGCLVGLVTALPLAAWVAGRETPGIDTAIAQLSVASGAVGGFVYWLIAGRTAGMWLDLRWTDRR